MTDIDSNDPNSLLFNPNGALPMTSTATASGAAPVSPPIATPDPRFGAAVPRKHNISGFPLAILVFILGAFIWFYSETVKVELSRFDRVWHTLSGILLSPPDESKIIILALIAMFVAAFSQTYREQKMLAKEEISLASLRAKISQNNGRVNSQLLISSLQDQASDSVLVRAVQAVWQVRNLQTPDLEAISAAVFVLEARRTGQGRSVANRLLLLSLLGTVIGLAGVIGTLQSQIGAVSGGDAETLLPKLGETLTTMGTAFSSTTYGIILCVVIAAYASSVNERRSHHVAEVQYFAVCELAPCLLPVSLPQAISQIEALVSQSEVFVIESRTLLDETRARNIAYLQEMDQKTRESARLTANVVAGIETTIRAAAKEVHDALADAGKYVVDGAKAQITVAKNLDKLLGESTTSLENAAVELKTGMQALSGASVTVQSAYKGLNTAVADLKTSLDGQAQSIGDAVRGRLTEAANAAVAQQAAIQEMSKNASNAALVQQTAMKRISDDITTALTNLTTQMSDFVRRSEPKLPSEQEWSRLQKTLDRCADASATFAAAMGRLEKDGIVSPTSKHTNTSFSGVTYSEMQQLLTEVTRQVTNSIAAAPQPLQADLRLFSQDMRQIIQRMEQLNQQTMQRRAELPPYRPPSTTAEPRPVDPYSYGGNMPSGEELHARQQPPVPPVQAGTPAPASAPEKRGASWWPFGKKE